METAKLKKFAQFARRSLLEQVSGKLKLVLAENSAARRENPMAVAEIEKQIFGVAGKYTDHSPLATDHSHRRAQLVDRVAYIWFNRFCALRFMDVNRYTRIGVVSPAEGQFQPEILAEAKMGHIDDEMVPDKVRQQIFALLAGSAPSRDPQGEAYRLLVVAACNFWNKAMPFLFQRIDDYTELLMPDDLLSENSILAHMREAICLPTTEGARGQGLEASKDKTDHWPLATNHSSTSLEVEVIGWLYQFYISEKKDEVFDGLKKNKKITPENIPAATQLFTPHWIVKYLVENSLGRLWMLNRPNSRLIDKMEYYIRPDTSGVRDQGLGVRGGNYGSEKLSGSDRLAKGDGLGGNGLSSDERLSQGRALRTDQSGSKGGSVNPVQHSGGARSQVDGRVQELPFDSAGLQGGSGNSNPNSPKTALPLSAAGAGNTLFAKGNQQNAGGSEKQTNPWPLTPNPSASTHEEDFLRVEKPEDIKICDPACGSGHMLTYAFDLLYAIYEEEGYEPAEIPEKILTNNLYGIEIDERAGELAAFALTMKARAKQRRFFNKGVKPNICVLENVRFDEGELKEVLSDQWLVASGASREDILHDLNLFEEADNFGSLVRPHLTFEQCTKLRDYLTGHWSLATSHSLFDSMTHQKVLQALRQADYLSQKYHVVIANPPYLASGKGMNERLIDWTKDNFPNSKPDLFSMFIERNIELATDRGMIAMITMQSWMFLSSFERFRNALLDQAVVLSMAHLGARAFDTIGGEVVQTSAFVLAKTYSPTNKGIYIRAIYGKSEKEKSDFLINNINNPDSEHNYRVSANDFDKIPGKPIAYWISKNILSLFNNHALDNYYFSEGPCKTGNDDLYLRQLWEVNARDVSPERKWCFCSKGGEYRKYYGNIEHLIKWDEKSRWHYKNDKIGRITADYVQNEEGITWSIISSKIGYSFRLLPSNAQFNSVSPTIFAKNKVAKATRQGLHFLNSTVANKILSILNPTLALNVGNVLSLPSITVQSASLGCDDLINIAKIDWNSYETSWDFTNLPLLHPDYSQPTLRGTYQKLRVHWREMTLEMQRLEEENNRIFIEAYRLQNELTPEVPLNEITLTCNPHYRYGNDKSEDELEALLLADTMRELVSYAVGCMFGRYALDKPGLILANQGETIEDYLKRVPEPSFPADDDNVIPMLDGDWFTDDIAERFRKFLRVAFGEEHYEANLRFVEQALNIKGKRNYSIRDYFLGEFYNDHVKRYKKRPIYWLFSSPKGSFNALIYMHRYRPDTVSVVLNDYLREFRAKLSSHKNHLEAVSISASSSQGEKTKALKEIEKITKMIAEMEEYEREVLYPLATEQVEIDLDDGVKINYSKLGSALKRIPGLEAKGES